MICKNCGTENTDTKFCVECGAPLTEETKTVLTEDESLPQEAKAVEEMLPQDESDIFEKMLSKDETDDFEKMLSKDETDDFEKMLRQDMADVTEETASQDENEDEEEPKSSEVMEALENLEKYETGTITHPSEKPKEKRSFWCPRNPVLWSFLWLLAFGAALGGLAALFFSIDIGGTQIIFGIVFALFAVAVLSLDFTYYLPAALTLDRMFKGKGVRLEYRLKDSELVEQAEKTKNRNRGFYLVIGLFGLAFSIYYIYLIANPNTTALTALVWISLGFSICVFIICGLLFFLMPKYNYLRMMQGGKRVIIGDRSVYYGGSYYHWRNVQSKATYGNINSRKHELQLTFVQEFKNGKTQRRKVDIYIPDRELNNAANLISAYEVSAKAYQEKQMRNSVLNESRNKNKK